eukprot:TRINITY_DN980_c0_g1_i1.p2 TRINITY_DN980_c0_g1~~TRINITY_DN980_c0_g1_i1.p2  ORF type:complete len:242 (-),score=17.08 TRINITY_DN980_c0_g1_i1:471-1196(-)
MMNRKLEGDTREKLWNILNLEKEIKEKAYKRKVAHVTIFETYKAAIENDEGLLPHENPKRNILYFCCKNCHHSFAIKQAEPAKVQKVLSPKYEGNDIKKQLLGEALKHSFLEGHIGRDEYEIGKTNADRISAFTPLRIRFNSTMRNTNKGNPYANDKVQLRARKLLKRKLRILNLSIKNRYVNAESSNSRNNSMITEHVSPKTPCRIQTDLTPNIKANGTINGTAIQVYASKQIQDAIIHT